MSLRTALLKRNEFGFMMRLHFLLKVLKLEARSSMRSETCMCIDDLQSCVLLLLSIFIFFWNTFTSGRSNFRPSF